MPTTTMDLSTTPNIVHVSFYETYKDSGRSPELIALHGGRWLIACLGLSMNVFLIMATIKSKNLHNRCNILIAAEAFANGLYQLSPSATFFLALTGIDFVPLETCLFVQALPLFGVHMSLLCSLFIGLDRFLSFKFPLWINSFNPRHYVGCLLGMSIIYGVVYVVQCYFICYGLGYLPLKVMCTITLDCFQGLLVEAKCLYSVMTINLATVLVYLALMVVVKQREYQRKIAAAPQPYPSKPAVGENGAKNGANMSTGRSFTQRILKSLLWITCVNIAGWCIAIVCRIVHPYLFVNEIHSVMFVNGVSYLTNLTSASTAPILFINSEEYRKAFRQLFGSYVETGHTVIAQSSADQQIEHKSNGRWAQERTATTRSMRTTASNNIGSGGDKKKDEKKC